MCKVLFLSSETNREKQQIIQRAKVAGKAAGDKIFFLFGKDAQCIEKIRHILKKKKPDKILLDMGHLTQKSLTLLKSLGLTLRGVGSNVYLIENQSMAA